MKKLSLLFFSFLALGAADTPAGTGGITQDQTDALVIQWTLLSNINENTAQMFADKPAYWLYHGQATAYLDCTQQLQKQATKVSAAPTSTGLFANMSCRARVGAGNDTFIMGFVIRDNPKDVLVRAVGPSLSQYDLTNGIPDPQLIIYDVTGKVVASAYGPPAPLPDGVTPITPPLTFDASGVAPLLPGAKDAYTFLTLPAGVYTVHVSSQSGADGIALVELYETTISPLHP